MNLSPLSIVMTTPGMEPTNSRLRRKLRKTAEIVLFCSKFFLVSRHSGGRWNKSDQITNKRPMIPVTVMVMDVSGKEDRFALESHGFQYYTHISAETRFGGDQTIHDSYDHECKDLLKNM